MSVAEYLRSRRDWLFGKNARQGETIEALALALDARDSTTHSHALRVRVYALGLGKSLNLTPATKRLLSASALLHDIGKVHIPDAILLKPAKLTEAEFDEMKRHTIVGAQIAIRRGLPVEVAAAIRSHHERWDGSGYPDGLCGEDIPLLAQIIGVADCFDALREVRPYRTPLSRGEAVKILRDDSGTRFDPVLIERFLHCLPVLESKIKCLPVNVSFAEQLTSAARAVAPAAGYSQ